MRPAAPWSVAFDSFNIFRRRCFGHERFGAEFVRATVAFRPASTTSAAGSAQQPYTPDQQSSDQQPTAQEPSGNDQGMFVFRKQIEEVVLHATVVDEQQHLVTGLDKSAFTVYEQGQPQTITSFRREDVPVEMGIVVDNSGSMRDKRGQDKPGGSESGSCQQSGGSGLRRELRPKAVSGPGFHLGREPAAGGAAPGFGKREHGAL